jgi:curli biogenesis system outer membrane secretion channel CsgG
MAVYCGVCAVRLSSAIENDGSFNTNKDFKGWDTQGTSRSRISDTCEPCGKILRAAVTKAANEIIIQNAPDVEALRQQQKETRDREARSSKEKAEFETAWSQERLRRGV